MSSQKLPKHHRESLVSIATAVHETVLSIAKVSLLDSSRALGEVDLEDEDSLVEYAVRAEQAAQVLGYLANALNAERDRVEAAIQQRGIGTPALAQKMNSAALASAERARAQIMNELAIVRESAAPIMAAIERTLNNGSDN